MRQLPVLEGKETKKHIDKEVREGIRETPGSCASFEER